MRRMVCGSLSDGTERGCMAQRAPAGRRRDMELGKGSAWTHDERCGCRWGGERTLPAARSRTLGAITTASPLAVPVRRLLRGLLRS